MIPKPVKEFVALGEHTYESGCKKARNQTIDECDKYYEQRLQGAVMSVKEIKKVISDIWWDEGVMAREMDLAKAIHKEMMKRMKL